MSDDAQTGWADIWTGRWRWIPEVANYTDPARAIRSQIADVTVAGLDCRIDQRFELLDGTKLGWTWDGRFDGQMRPIRWHHDGSEMIDIAFYLLTEGMGGDSYTTRDGLKAGSEYWRLKPGRLDVWGCYTSAGRQWPYYEAWEQIV